MKTGFLFVVFSIFLAVCRFFVPTHPLSLPGSYEAVAHLFLGGLIGIWAVTGSKLCGFLTLSLSAVEVAAFFALR